MFQQNQDHQDRAEWEQDQDTWIDFHDIMEWETLRAKYHSSGKTFYRQTPYEHYLFDVSSYLLKPCQNANKPVSTWSMENENNTKCALFHFLIPQDCQATLQEDSKAWEDWSTSSAVIGCDRRFGICCEVGLPTSTVDVNLVSRLHTFSWCLWKSRISFLCGPMGKILSLWHPQNLSILLSQNASMWVDIIWFSLEIHWTHVLCGAAMLPFVKKQLHLFVLQVYSL